MSIGGLCALQAELVTAREGLQQAEASALAAAAQCTSLQQVGALRASGAPQASMAQFES